MYNKYPLFLKVVRIGSSIVHPFLHTVAQQCNTNRKRTSDMLSDVE